MRYRGQRLYIRQNKQPKKKSIKDKNKKFCSKISDLVSTTSSPSLKLIMLAMQYSKGTLYCSLPLPLILLLSVQIKYHQNI